MISEQKVNILDIVDFNPKRVVKKGVVAPFVEMSFLPAGSRNLIEIGEREFKGSGSKFMNGDTLFARITPCLENGKTAKVSGLPDGVAASGSTEFIVMAAKDQKYDEDYIYYLSRLPKFRLYAQARMEGTSGRQRVAWQALAEFNFEFPVKQQRKKIGDFLKSLDDKIELNRQTNRTLEEMAQAVFKSWFVDFEPTRAKIKACENGQDPTRAAMAAIAGKTVDQLNALSLQRIETLTATADLFPDALVPSELGEIPDGWVVKNIGEIVSRLKPSKRYTKKQVESSGSVPVFEQGAKVLLGFHSEEAGFVASPEKPLFIFGDHTCVVHLSCQNFDISQNVIPLSGKGYPTIWVYYAIQGKQEFQEYRRHWSELIVKGVVAPKSELAIAYSVLVTTLYKKKEKLVMESKSLEQIRDTLLPKLLSGELEVANGD